MHPPSELDPPNHITPQVFFLGNMATWEGNKYGGASLATADTYRTVGKILISESDVWNIEVEVNDNIYGNTKKTKMNTCPPPNMAVVYRRVMTGLMVKVKEMALVELEEEMGTRTAAVKSHIELLWDISPPKSPIP